MKNIKAFVLALALVIGIQYATAAWTNPSATPPGNNTDTPINVGLTQQNKLGSLFINTDSTHPYTVGLGVFGNSVFNGSIAIVDGTQHAGYVLTSDGNGNASWQPPTGNSTTVNNGNNIHFLSAPITLQRNVHTPLQTWQDFDISADIPADATAMILTVACPNQSDSNTTYPSYIRERDSASSASYTTICSNAPGPLTSAPTQQVTVPIGSETFQLYHLGSVSISLVGYTD